MDGGKERRGKSKEAHRGGKAEEEISHKKKGEEGDKKVTGEIIEKKIKRGCDGWVRKIRVKREEGLKRATSTLHLEPIYIKNIPLQLNHSECTPATEVSLQENPGCHFSPREAGFFHSLSL